MVKFIYKYGSYMPGQTASLSPEAEEWLISRRYADRVEVLPPLQPGPPKAPLTTRAKKKPAR